MQIASRKLKSLVDTLKYFTEHKEATTEEIAAYLEKDYTTALRVLAILLKYGLVKLEREEPTGAKGKQKRFYSLTFHGLEYYLNIDQTFSSIREIAKAHADMFMVFKKWEKFVEGKCEGAIILNLKTALKMANWTNNVMVPYILGETVNAGQRSEAPQGFTIAVLGFHYLSCPIEHEKEVLGENWPGQQRIWKVVENDYDLRMIRENIIHRFEVESTERLKALAGWRSFFSNREGGETE